MNKKYNFGIIGCSSIAERSSIPAMKSSNKLRLVRVGSRSFSKANRIAKKNHIPNYGNYEEVLEDEDVDIVYISLPIALQKEWIIKSLNAGKHVISEKSAVTSYKDAKKVIQLARKGNLNIMENFAFKNHPQHKFVLNFIEKKKVGNIFSFSSSFGFMLSKNSEKFRLNKKLGGGVLNDVGCYGIAACQMLFREKPILLNCTLTTNKKSNVDTSGIVTIKFEENKFALIQFSFESAFQSNYTVWGSKAIINLPRAYNVRNNIDSLIEIKTDVGIKYKKIKPSDQFKNTFEVFAKSDTSNNTFHKEFLNQAKIMEACRNSNKKRKPIIFGK